MMSQTLAGGVTPTPGNVALNKAVTASDVISASESADKAVDGSGTTKWTSNPPSSTPGDKWLKVDLGGMSLRFMGAELESGLSS